jgi:glyoxylase-like metal-dependent hydrolase (beta-lactamase superfamily II)
MKQEIIRLDLNQVNCYLGKSEKGYVLFDTAGPITMDKNYSNRRIELEAELEKAGCKPGNLNAIVITHGDMDHVANAAYLRDKYKTVIAMHREDVNLTEALTVDKMMESFHYKSVILNLVFLLLRKTIRRVMEKAYHDFTKFTPDILLKEGDSLSSYGFDAKIIHLPGHTAGSIGILTAEGDLIAGDTFTNLKKPSAALNADDFKQLKYSIDRLKRMNLSKMIYPGHGKPFQAGEYKF